MSRPDDSIIVLHVEDDEAFAELAVLSLERADERLNVVSAGGVDTGLDRLEDTNVDCIVSDYEMPNRDGLELLKTVRERDTHVPFILFTGTAGGTIREAALTAGATAFVRKRNIPDQFKKLATLIVDCAAERQPVHQTNHPVNPESDVG